MQKRQAETWGGTALVLGGLCLVPCLGPLFVVPAIAYSTARWIRASRFPESGETRLPAVLGMVLALVGLALSITEGRAFLRWKSQQAYEQRRLLTQARMVELQGALEAYRAANGTYPTTSSVGDLCGALVPAHLQECPACDGWGREFVVSSSPYSYRIEILPLRAPPSGAPPKS